MRYSALMVIIAAVAGVLLAAEPQVPPSATSPVTQPSLSEARKLVTANPCFQCTQVIAYSQAGSPKGGWFVVSGAFESIVPNDQWQLLWHSGAGVDRWCDANYVGWKSPLVSACPKNSDKPDRIVLSISGGIGDDEDAWAQAIEQTIVNIQTKYPSARQIVLQPVVGGPGGKSLPIPAGAKDKAGRGMIRASWQHNHINNAIKFVVAKHEKDRGAVRIVHGFTPQVRSADDYTDGLGHLTSEGGAAAGRAIAEYYLLHDAACAASGHAECNRPVAQ